MISEKWWEFGMIVNIDLVFLQDDILEVKGNAVLWIFDSGIVEKCRRVSLFFLRLSFRFNLLSTGLFTLDEDKRWSEKSFNICRHIMLMITMELVSSVSETHAKHYFRNTLQPNGSESACTWKPHGQLHAVSKHFFRNESSFMWHWSLYIRHKTRDESV